MSGSTTRSLLSRLKASLHLPPTCRRWKAIVNLASSPCCPQTLKRTQVMFTCRRWKAITNPA